MALRYTLCFCRHSDRLLMLLRRKPPHAGQWNGVGGKIEPGESPRDCARRETLEETGIDLALANSVRFVGIVTWPPDDAVNGQGSGMYVFIADFSDPTVCWSEDRPVPDGTLSWRLITWVCDPANPLVVENISHFLPPMLRGDSPREFYCDFQDDVLLSVEPRAWVAESADDE